MEPELILGDEIEQTTAPSLTYLVDGNRILGQVDGLNAMVQAVQKVLNTELWSYVIYGDDYGVELDRLIGKEFDFVKSDLERTITSCLEVDDRFISLENFEIIEKGNDSLLVSFNVISTEGDFFITQEVSS